MAAVHRPPSAVCRQPVEQVRGELREGQGLEFPFSPANLERNKIDRLTEIKETMMVGMRLTEEGVSVAEFSERFRLNLLQVYAIQIEKLTREGLIEVSDCVRLSERGRLLGNRVFGQFVNAELDVAG